MTMRALALLTSISLAACAGRPAVQPAPAAGPAVAEASAEPRRGALADIEVVTSPGGVTAWLVSEPSIPIIAMEMSWKGGAALEPDEALGASWVLGYMMNEGAGDLDSQAFAARMEDLNMSFGCEVNADWTRCSFSTLSETAEDSFDLVRLALAEPRFDPEPIERAKRELEVSLARAESNPSVLASREMAAFLMPGHPYERVATVEGVRTLDRDDVTALKDRLMTRDSLLVTVVGDIDAATLSPLLDRLFSRLPARPPLAFPADISLPRAPERPIVKDYPSPQTVVLFSGPGLKREDPDFYAAYVLNYILGGGGFSSRLMDDIREKRGLTYGIGSGLSLQRHVARWTGSAQTKNETAHELVGLVRKHLGDLAAAGPTEKELQDAKAYLTGAYPLQFDSNSKIADNLIAVRQDELGEDYVARRNDYINAVTLDDLKRVAARYLDPADFTFVLVGRPVSEAKAG